MVGYPHELKGTAICAFVVLTPDFESLPTEDLVGALKEQVRHVIGPIAAPERIQICQQLPKTRSGKLMRRVLRQIALGEYTNLGDVTTLADPAVVEVLVADVRRQHEEVNE